MELKEFVKDILLQIVNAANECNEDFVNNSIDASIENPHGCSMIDFDLAVESVEQTKKEVAYQFKFCKYLKQEEN